MGLIDRVLSPMVSDPTHAHTPPTYPSSIHPTTYNTHTHKQPRSPAPPPVAAAKASHHPSHNGCNDNGTPPPSSLRCSAPSSQSREGGSCGRWWGQGGAAAAGGGGAVAGGREGATAAPLICRIRIMRWVWVFGGGLGGLGGMRVYNILYMDVYVHVYTSQPNHTPRYIYTPKPKLGVLCRARAEAGLVVRAADRGGLLRRGG